MHDYCGKFVCSDPVVRVLLLVINQINASTRNDVADFTSDGKFTNTLEYNVNINISDISNYETRYGNIQSKRSKQVDSATLYKRWNIDLGKAKKTVTRKTQRGVQSFMHPTLGRQ